MVNKTQAGLRTSFLGPSHAQNTVAFSQSTRFYSLVANLPLRGQCWSRTNFPFHHRHLATTPKSKQWRKFYRHLIKPQEWLSKIYQFKKQLDLVIMSGILENNNDSMLRSNVILISNTIPHLMRDPELRYGSRIKVSGKCLLTTVPTTSLLCPRKSAPPKYFSIHRKLL